MWHEARKQEKKIRGMIVDYRKRADRRKEFYERIRADPTQFLQLHGRKYKINFDVADLTDESHMMKWQGQSDNLIDRFDVRAHLDYIPPVKPVKDEKEPEATSEERLINYERFRILAQNEFLGVSEDHFLKQLQLEEQFGVNAHQVDHHDKNKKKNSQANAAIGFDYGGGDSGSTTVTVPFSQTILNIESAANSNRYEEFSKDYSDDSDIDMDVAIDINKIGTTEAHELNNCGKRYGMMTNDFFSYLTKDEDEKQSMKALKEQEADKILGGGRKSRRERRSQREKRVLGKPLSPPSYAAKEEKVEPSKEELEDDEDDKSSRDNSRSPSPEKITYITSFGGEDELKPHSKISIKLNKPTVKVPGTSRNTGFTSYADKVKQNLDKFKRVNEVEKDRPDYRRRSPSVNRTRRSSRSRSRRRHDSSRSRSTARRRRYSSRSRSRSVSRRRRDYSSRSRSHSRRRTRSSRSYSKTSYTSTSRDRSRSPRRRRSIPKRKKSLSRRRSYSNDKKSTSRRRSISKKRSRTPKRSTSRKRSISKKRSYSSSSSSSTSSSSSSKSSVSSPEKQPREKSSPTQRTKSLSKEKHSSSSQTLIDSSSEAAAPVKRYYGRKKENDSSSSLSVDSGSDDNEKKSAQANEPSKIKSTIRSSEFKVGIARSNTIGGPKTHNPREKLKKKMQSLLNKQYKADKKAETERIERLQQQQQERDEEMKELALKLRRRQRELRHRYGDNPDSKSESESDTKVSPSRKKRRSPSPSTSSSSSSSRSSSHSRNRQKKPIQNISRSPVKYNRRSRSRSAGRNYSRRYTRSRSRDYRR